MNEDLPPEFLSGLDERSRWMYQRIYDQGRLLGTICDTQNRILERMEKGDRRFEVLERDVKQLQETKLIISSKWQVVALLTAGVLVPVALIIAGAWFKSLWH